MAIDASIYGMIRPQVAPTDPMEQYAKALSLKTMMGQNAMQDLQGEKLRRDFTADESIRNLFASNPKPEVGQIMAIDPARGMQFQKTQLENDKTRAEIDKLNLDKLDKSLNLHRDQLASVNDPQTAAQWVMAGFNDPTLSPILQRAGSPQEVIARIPTDPQGFQKWKIENGVGIAKMLDLTASKLQPVNTGKQTVLQETNPLAQGFTGAPITMTTTPGQDQTDARTKSEGNLNRGVTIRGQNMTDTRAREQIDAGKWQNDLGRGIQVNTATGATRPITTGGVPIAPNDNAPEAMLKAAGYADRMDRSEKILTEFAKAGKPGFIEATAGGVPLIGPVAANASRSTERQQFYQAAEDWVRAKLRQESGAVIADEEMAREIRTYFPMIGDKPEVIKQKAAARETAQRAMVTAAGRAMKSNTGGATGSFATPDISGVTQADIDAELKRRGIIK